MTRKEITHVGQTHDAIGWFSRKIARFRNALQDPELSKRKRRGALRRMRRFEELRNNAKKTASKFTR